MTTRYSGRGVNRIISRALRNGMFKVRHGHPGKQFPNGIHQFRRKKRFLRSLLTPRKYIRQGNTCPGRTYSSPLIRLYFPNVVGPYFWIRARSAQFSKSPAVYLVSLVARPSKFGEVSIRRRDATRSDIATVSPEWPPSRRLLPSEVFSGIRPIAGSSRINAFCCVM